jgi:hypothetical protein
LPSVQSSCHSKFNWSLFAFWIPISKSKRFF